MNKFFARFSSLFGLRDARGKVLLWALLASMVCGLLEFGEPLDVGFRAVRNQLRTQPVSGDIVVVGVDAKAMADASGKRNELAFLSRSADAIERAGAKRLYIDLPMIDPKHAFIKARTAAGPKAGSMEVFRTLDTETGDLRSRIGGESLPDAVDPARLVHVETPGDFLDFVWSVEAAVLVDGRVIPSMAASLADKRVALNGANWIDYSYSAKSVPFVKARDIVDGSAAKAVAGKTVVMVPATPSLGQFAFLPGRGEFPRAYIAILGAETLKAGTPVYAGWMLPLAFMSIIAIIQLAFGGIVRKLAVGTGIVSLLVAPLILESNLIFVDIAPALILCAAVGIWTMWARAGRRGSLINAMTGLFNLSALRGAVPPGNQSLVVALVRNFGEARSSLPQEVEPALIRQIAHRLSLGTAGAALYQADDGSFAWFVDPGVEVELEDQLEALHTMFRSPVVIGDRQIDLDVTFGVDRNHGRSTSNRYGSAWIAAGEAGMEGAKWKGFDAAKLHDAEWKLSMLGQLDTAIDNGEVWVAYQPQVSATTGEIFGAEALVRWSHPAKGEISPGEFVAAAEQHNRIEKLTDHVLDRSIAAAAEINGRGRSFVISVNLSAKLLEMPGLRDKVANTLARHGLPAHKLTLELTESVAVDGNTLALQTLMELRDLGVRISIDDYGTGFSTLDYLKRVPACEVKIDRSFIRNLSSNESDRIVVSSTIALAHSLNIAVVAEGIETEETLALLRAMGCDGIQGYLTGPPMQLQKLIDRLAAPKSRVAA